MTDHDRELGSALRYLPVPDHAEGFWDTVEARLVDDGPVPLEAARRRRLRPLPPRAPWVLSLAAVALVVATTVALARPDDTTVRVPPATTSPTGRPEWSVMAPSPLSPRTDHAAAWTGRVMLVWGGAGSDATYLADGAAYDPEADRWNAMAPAPMPALHEPTAIWTGRRLVVWGLVGGAHEPSRTAGALYDPENDRWTPMAGSPLTPRGDYSAVWTGERMIVWGGSGDGERWFADGAAYDLGTDRWTRIAAAPVAPRDDHTAVWTGREMIVWGGNGEETSGLVFDDGAAYDPAADAWTVLPASPLAPRWGHLAEWVDDRMVVLGGVVMLDPGRGGAVYQPATRTWSALAGPQVLPRFHAAAVAAGDRLLVFGGQGMTVPEGAVFDPAAGSGFAMSPSPLRPRSGHTAVWNGAEMIVWGGSAGDRFNARELLADGARYRPPS